MFHETKKIKNIVRFATLLSILTFICFPAHAQQRIVVSNSGELKQALTNAPDSSTIVLKKGEYSPLEIRRSNITLEAEELEAFKRTQSHADLFNTEQVRGDITLLPHFSGNKEVIIDIRESSHVTLRGLYVSGAHQNEIRVSLQNNITIEHCVLTGQKPDKNARFWGNGILFHGSRNAQALSNVIYDMDADHAIYFAESENDDVKAIGNIIIDIRHGPALQLNAEDPNGGDRVITKPYIANNVIIGGPFAVNICGVQEGRFENNLIVNVKKGVTVWSGNGCKKSTNNTFYHNTITSTQLHALEFQDSGNTAINNILLGGRADVDDCVNITAKGCRGTVYTPSSLFVNVNRDFHLIAGSPAIDKGQPLTDVTVDLDGNTRPAGSAWDFGAYEAFGTSVSTPTPTPSSNTPIPTPTANPEIGGGICPTTQSCITTSLASAITSCRANNPGCFLGSDRRPVIPRDSMFALSTQTLAERAVLLRKCREKTTKKSCDECYVKAKDMLRPKKVNLSAYRGMFANAVKMVEAEQASACSSRN